MDNDKSFVLPCDNGSDSEMEVIDDDDGTSEQSMEIGNEDVLQETSTPMEKTDQRPSTNRQADEQVSIFKFSHESKQSNYLERCNNMLFFSIQVFWNGNQREHCEFSKDFN